MIMKKIHNVVLRLNCTDNEIMSRSKAGCADNNEIVNSEDQDQTVLLCSLISVHTIRIIACDSLTLIAKKKTDHHKD